VIDQGLRVFLDVDFFSDFQDFWMLVFLEQLDLVFRWILIHSFSLSSDKLDFSEPAYQSYLTIQTYNRKAFTAREETLYLKDAVITDMLVDLRYTLLVYGLRIWDSA